MAQELLRRYVLKVGRVAGRYEQTRGSVCVGVGGGGVGGWGGAPRTPTAPGSAMGLLGASSAGA